jgi:adenylate cyclase
MALAVERSRRLVVRQATAARERANLARYFSPNMVEALAESDQPLGPVCRQPAAVLFCDIIGFTRIAETLGPDGTIALLRDFHGRVSSAVFAHGGTLDKFMGDAVMATFGTPNPGPRDAVNAVTCARAIADAMEKWNADRSANGDAPVHAGIGVHYGDVVIGDIGGDGGFEFAVIGDTVNVASRLESLTRALSVDVVISEDLAAAARDQGGADALGGFAPAPPQALHNRTAPMPVLTWRRSGPQPPAT